MTYLTQADVVRLTKSQRGDCVSLYVGLNPDPQKSSENSIRLKNLLNQAEEDLVARGMRSVGARDIMAPANELLAKLSRETAGSRGLALFACEGYFEPIFLPESVAERVLVYDSFYVLPLLPVAAIDSLSFHLLAASANGARLFKGSRRGLTKVDVPHMPGSQAETLNYQPAGRSLQVHGGVTLGKSGQSTVYHGQGGAGDFSKEESLEYLRAVENAVTAFLRDEHSPLYFAGVDELFPLYRQVNRYSHLMDEPVSGSPDRLSKQDLHAATWPRVIRQFEDTTRSAVAKCILSASNDPAAHELAPVLRAARTGRVDTLCVARDRQQWGTFDTAQDRISLSKDRKDRDDELLNLAAITAIEHHGRVIIVPAAELPEQSVVAATFRYHVTRPRPK